MPEAFSSSNWGTSFFFILLVQWRLSASATGNSRSTYFPCLLTSELQGRARVAPWPQVKMYDSSVPNGQTQRLRAARFRYLFATRRSRGDPGLDG